MSDTGFMTRAGNRAAQFGSAVANNRLVQSDLAMGSGSFLQSVGSISQNFGVIGTQLSGTSHQTAIFANRVMERGMFGPNARFVTAQGQLANSFDEAFNTSRMAQGKYLNNALGRAAYRTGLGGFSLTGSFGMAFSAMTAIGSFSSSMRQGNGVIGSVGAAGASVLKDALMMRGISAAVSNPYVALGVATAGGAYMAARTVVNAINQGNQYNGGPRGSHELMGNASASMHTAAAATMRQRALASINNSQFNAMRSLGNEASFMRSPRSRYGDTSQGPVPRPILGY